MQKTTDKKALLAKLRKRLRLVHATRQREIAKDDGSAQLVALHQVCETELAEFIEQVEHDE